MLVRLMDHRSPLFQNPVKKALRDSDELEVETSVNTSYEGLADIILLHVAPYSWVNCINAISDKYPILAISSVGVFSTHIDVTKISRTHIYWADKWCCDMKYSKSMFTPGLLPTIDGTSLFQKFLERLENGL